jgi:general secretion pathway protein G
MFWNFRPNLLRAKACACSLAAKALAECTFVSYQHSVLTLAKTQIKNVRGFTLLELLAVISLLGLLAVLAVVSYEGVGEEASIKVAQVEMSELRKALRQFKRDVGHYPDEIGLNLTEEDRVRLLVNCTSTDDAGCVNWNIDTARGWHGPYVLSEGIADSWATPYRLSYENLQPRLISLGGNKQYEGVNTTDRCLPNGVNSDDIVLCLLK